MRGATKNKKIISLGLLAALFLTIGLYSYTKAANIINGADIQLQNISDGMTVADPLLSVAGNAKNSSSLTINDRPISVNQDYDFKESLLLLPGYNTITLSAIDRFGKKKEVTVHVVYSDPTPPNEALSTTMGKNL